MVGETAGNLARPAACPINNYTASLLLSYFTHTIKLSTFLKVREGETIQYNAASILLVLYIYKTIVCIFKKQGTH